MAMTSTLVTAKSPSEMANYKVKIPSTVSSDALVVNPQMAKNVYNEIINDYNSLVSAFKSLGNGFNISKQFVTGEKFKKRLAKSANACTNQGQYCANRRRELEEAFRFAELEKRVSELENNLNTIA